MHLSTREQSALARAFAVLADDMDARSLRLALGGALLDLLGADHFASFVWDADRRVFDDGVWLNMDAANLARYDAWYQHHDPITLRLQACRRATAVSEVMPHRALRRTEFFNDFLARDGLHWGINLHAFGGARALGDLRIWRGRARREFEPHDKALLDLVEPAFVAALARRRPARTGTHPGAPGPELPRLSVREREVALALRRGRTDKEIARELGLAVPSVRTYLARLQDKTGASRRAGLAAWRPGRRSWRTDQRTGGAGRRPSRASTASPIAIRRRSLPRGPSSSSPTGSRVVGPSPVGNCRPGRPALLPGSVLRIAPTNTGTLLDSGPAGIATCGTVGKTSASSRFALKSSAYRACSAGRAVFIAAS